MTHPIEIRQGATFVLPFRWHESTVVDGETVIGEPIDVTGYTARMQVRKKQGAPAIIDATTENGQIAVGGEDGRFVVTVPAAVTSLLSFKDGVYDFEAYAPSDGPTYILIEVSPVSVIPNITQLPGEPVLK